MQRQSFLASNVYAGQHPKPQHWVPTPKRKTLQRQAISNVTQKLHVLQFDFVMIRSERKLTLTCIKIRPVTSLGHQGGQRVFWEGPKFFKLCPRHFSRWGEKFLGEASPPCLRVWQKYICCWHTEWFVSFESVQLAKGCPYLVYIVNAGEFMPWLTWSSPEVYAPCGSWWWWNTLLYIRACNQ